MNTELFEKLKSSAESLGVHPQWLNNGVIPEFEAVEKNPEQVADVLNNVSLTDVSKDKVKKREMILLHGLFGALSNWDSTFDLFSKFTHPIALKFPITTGHSSEIKVKSLTLLTEYFLRQRSLDKVILCGNSLGGHVALRLCLLRPDIVDCLILAGSSGLYEHTVDSLPVRPKHDFVIDQMARVFYDKKFINEKAIEDIVQILSSKSRVLNLIQSARSAKRDNLEKLLPTIKVPTLLLWGEDDKITTMEVANQFATLLPNATLVTKKQCGHAPMIEHPEWFASEVEKFLSKNGLI